MELLMLSLTPPNWDLGSFSSPRNGSYRQSIRNQSPDQHSSACLIDPFLPLKKHSQPQSHLLAPSLCVQSLSFHVAPKSPSLSPRPHAAQFESTSAQMNCSFLICSVYSSTVHVSAKGTQGERAHPHSPRGKEQPALVPDRPPGLPLSMAAGGPGPSFSITGSSSAASPSQALGPSLSISISRLFPETSESEGPTEKPTSLGSNWFQLRNQAGASVRAQVNKI